MPSSGGAAGKAGDRYELLWAVDAAVRVLRGEADSVTYESLEPEESLGVEFSVRTGEDNEFWSLKRQTTSAAGWTLALLTAPDPNGRSILQDLITHVERDSANVAVFASTLGAPKLDELRSAAQSWDALSARLDRSRELKEQFAKYVLPLFHGNTERVIHFLRRLQIRTVDEATLRMQVEATISYLFYREDGEMLQPAAIRRLLTEHLLGRMNIQLQRQSLVDASLVEGFRLCDWQVNKTVANCLSQLCAEFLDPLNNQLIGGRMQCVPGTDELSGSRGMPMDHRVLVVSGAGSGKSTALSEVLTRAIAAGVPAMPIRMDLITEEVSNLQLLGKALGLHTSPVAALAQLAHGRDCLLVLDQLDAVSVLSGRRTDVWFLFEKILREADIYPNLRLVVSCRLFDLEHDHRMRVLKPSFRTVTLQPLRPEVVDKILGIRSVSTQLRPLLTIPLHLAMFLELESEAGSPNTRDELFDAFWTQKEFNAARRLGRKCEFVSTLELLTRWLSEHQELAAPKYVLDPVSGDAAALTSEQVLVLAKGYYRFFHETFFDYAFARLFAQSRTTLTELLLSNEQHLFRRAQVRQILSFLRSNDFQRYVRELGSVLAHNRVRFHLKRVIFQFLSSITDPKLQEWETLVAVSVGNIEFAEHILRVPYNQPGWFDTLEEAGQLDADLSSSEKQRQGQAIWICAAPEILIRRSARVAALLRKHRRDDDQWRGHLHFICRNGSVGHSEDMFDFFLELVRDGTLDGLRPGFAVNDDWWSTLGALAREKPEQASVAIGVWFDRKVFLWRNQKHDSPDVGETSELEQHSIAIGTANEEACLWSKESLRGYLDSDGDVDEVVADAAKNAQVFSEQMLPRVASIIAEMAQPAVDHLNQDPIWGCRIYGSHSQSACAAVFTALAEALEALAHQDNAVLDKLLQPYLSWPHDSIVYLILRAWAAAPAIYGDKLALYLAEEKTRDGERGKSPDGVQTSHVRIAPIVGFTRIGWFKPSLLFGVWIVHCVPADHGENAWGPISLIPFLEKLGDAPAAWPIWD